METDKSKRKRQYKSRSPEREAALEKFRELSRNLRIPPFDPYASDEENEPALTGARMMFMEGFRYEDIVKAYLIPPSIFKEHAFEKSDCWLLERDKFQAELIKKAVEGNVEDVLNIRGLTIGALQKYLVRLNARESELSMKEAKLASDMLANLDRIYRLDASKPTEITKKYEAMTPEQVRAAIKEEVERLQSVDEIVDYSNPKSTSPDLVNFDDLERH